MRKALSSAAAALQPPQPTLAAPPILASFHSIHTSHCQPFPSHRQHITNISPPQDKKSLLQFGKANAVDFVALSFTRSAADVAEARAHLDAIGMRNTKLIAKIENKVRADVRVCV